PWLGGLYPRRGTRRPAACRAVPQRSPPPARPRCARVPPTRPAGRRRRSTALARPSGSRDLRPWLQPCCSLAAPDCLPSPGIGGRARSIAKRPFPTRGQGPSCFATNTPFCILPYKRAARHRLGRAALASVIHDSSRLIVVPGLRLALHEPAVGGARVALALQLRVQLGG